MLLKLKSGFSVFTGGPLGSKTATGVPRGYWNLSWVAEDDLSLASNSTSGEQDALRPLLIDRQAKALLSLRDALLPFP